MTNTKDVIIKLKEVRNERGLSYNDILNLLEENGDFISKSTISRVFADGSENETSFRYEETIRPIANALLDIDTIEDDDNADVKAMKTLLKYKDQRIRELESALEEEKAKYQDRFEFLNNQIALKDKRMDQLLDAVLAKESRYDEMLELIMNCPARKSYNGECK